VLLKKNLVLVREKFWWWCLGKTGAEPAVASAPEASKRGSNGAPRNSWSTNSNQ